MNICLKTVTTAAAAALGLLLAGCASPGPPLPPSLKLPQVVSAAGLSATRAGARVTLRWNTPSLTTDRLTIVGPITAEICRAELAELAVLNALPAAAAARYSASRNPPPAAPCAPAVLRLQVTPGASEAVDSLPASLLSGPARLLAYRVQLLNSMGRTVGASPAVYALAGAAPPPVVSLLATATKRGVLLEWKREAPSLGDLPGTPARDLGTTVELDRTVLAAPAAPASVSASKGSLPGTSEEPAEARFVSGTEDAGGTLDRSAQIGHTYRYTAQRVHSVAFGARTFELRSSPSTEVTVAVQDVFPPEPPQDLVAVPGFSGAGEIQQPAIDLSWDPNLEAHLAGYRIYRQFADVEMLGPQRKLNSELVTVAAYRDLTVEPGRRYTYRVTAVSDTGVESAPSLPAVESAPKQ